MIYIVSLSSGISSAIAAHRAIDRYGREAVRLVFMDTQWEDDDNYRFLNELGRFWDKDIISLRDGRTPLQVSSQEHIIPNQKIAPCTYRLKIELFVDFIRQYENVTVILGMNWTEPHRMKAPKENYAKIGVKVEYPCMWEPIDLDPFATVRSWGIEPPRMYRLGYAHANCGGRCVKQGISEWVRTYHNFPERFAEVEQWEAAMRQDKRFEDYAILRDQSGGMVRPFPLLQLRENIEAGLQQQPMLPLFEDDLSNCFCNAGDPGELTCNATA